MFGFERKPHFSGGGSKFDYAEVWGLIYVILEIRDFGVGSMFYFMVMFDQ